MYSDKVGTRLLRRIRWPALVCSWLVQPNYRAAIVFVVAFTRVETGSTKEDFLVSVSSMLDTASCGVIFMLLFAQGHLHGVQHGGLVCHSVLVARQQAKTTGSKPGRSWRDDARVRLYRVPAHG